MRVDGCILPLNASEVLEDQRVHRALLQGASKTNISLIVCDSEATAAVQGLHAEFFEGGG